VTACRATSRIPRTSTRLYDTVKREKGHIDILFGNAGTGSFAALGAITEDHFDRSSIQREGVVFTVQKALPLFREGGSIVLNASITASTGGPAFSVYSATKPRCARLREPGAST